MVIVEVDQCHCLVFDPDKPPSFRHTTPFEGGRIHCAGHSLPSVKGKTWMLL